MKTARFWRMDGVVQCGLCPHACRISEGSAGRCKVRCVRGGQLIASGYGLISSAAVDPMEKKPLYHFLPGQPIFSIGGWGCNFGCVFCQNWSISQKFEDRRRECDPRDVVAMAGQQGTKAVAFTYNEPLVGLEFVYDCAVLSRAAGLKNVLVTNGFVCSAPAAEVLPFIDALNIDVKSMDESFYRDQCKGSLQPVLDFAVQAVSAGCHVEITNLVIPGLNDGDGHFSRLADWIAGSLGRKTVLHLSGYHPDFKLDSPSTPGETLIRARELCRARLDYVYLGNTGGQDGHDTACPSCGNILIRRRGYAVSVCGITGSSCSACGRTADLIMS